MKQTRVAVVSCFVLHFIYLFILEIHLLMIEVTLAKATQFRKMAILGACTPDSNEVYTRSAGRRHT